MNKKILYISSLILLVMVTFFACKEEDYTLGELSAPSNLVITTAIAGQSTANPNGDGTGVVNITAHADNGMVYKIGYSPVSNITASPELEPMTQTSNVATATKKFSTLGINTYRITVVVYGKGGTSSVATKDVTVNSLFNPNPSIVTDLTNDSSKTWKVDVNTAGHFGVGPWSASSVTPEWWSAAPNEKVACCNCFYTARFTFKKVSATSFTLQSSTPDGVFTKTGALTNLPGIESGDEGCHPYGGGTSAFSFVPAGSGVAASAPTTQTSILLAGNTTFIGYGSLKSEYEIMSITPTALYLRVQGTETGNAWYIKLIPA